MQPTSKLERIRHLINLLFQKNPGLVHFYSVQKRSFEHSTTFGPDDFAERSAVDQAALVNHTDAVADLPDVGEDVRTEELAPFRRPYRLTGGP
jgi:hypothetical protein